MTGWSNVDLAVKAMRLGACDFVEKPWNNQRLIQIIRQQLKMAGLQVQNQKLKQQLESTTEQDFTWCSESMEKLLRQIDSVAATDASILLTGDNGTGKSHLAQRIHQQSTRASNAFISVNMGAISESLFESEMFGHKKGAFTDAKENRIGRFELAKHGTLFLDEIANIPQSQQAKLLRVLESGEYEVLGSSQTQLADSRIISATNGDIAQLISDGVFREDLYFRLNTIELRVPSLKERFQDIAPLAKHFLAEHGKKYKREELSLTAGALQALEAYHWPGNVREMSHLMERAVLLAQGGSLGQEDLHLSNLKKNNSLPMMTLEQAEKILIEQALELNHNNAPKAAVTLGLTKSSMYRRLEKYGIKE
jgi:DNA-binding NtrC family response regulator